MLTISFSFLFCRKMRDSVVITPGASTDSKVKREVKPVLLITPDSLS